jgi:hypothetical protein
MDRRAWLLGSTALLDARQAAWGQSGRRVIAVLNGAYAAGMSELRVSADEVIE